MANLQPDIVVPLYRQLYEKVSAKIEEGIYRPGEKIPSEDKLCEMYGVSRITVRRALNQLVEDNVLVKKHGKGTFVSNPRHVESMSAGGSFTRSCLLMNVTPGTKLISIEMQPVDKRIAQYLRVPEGTRVICIKRLRLVDATPAIFEVDYFRREYDFLLKYNLENTSLLELIEQETGMVAEHFEDVFEIKHASKEHADHLDCSIGMPLLRVKQTVTIDAERVLYYNEQFICSDRYQYAVRYC